MIDSFNTISATCEGLYKEKGSKFLAFAYPIDDEKLVKSKIDELKKIHFTARHHCYAYILGADKTKTRANDDGEPAHTAGTPILNQIRSSGLSNILIVVVRYFGGTKLGVPGLINAYKLAAADVLQKVEVIEKRIEKKLVVMASFDAMNEILKLVKQYQGELICQNYFEFSCEIHINFRQSIIQIVTAKINDLQANGLSLNMIDEE